MLRAVGRIGAASKASSGSLSGVGADVEADGGASAGEAMSTATRPAIGCGSRGWRWLSWARDGSGRPMAPRRPDRGSAPRLGGDAAEADASAVWAAMAARGGDRPGKDDGCSEPGRRLECCACPISPRPEEATRLARNATATILPPACCDMPTHVPARGITWSGRSGVNRTVPSPSPPPDVDLNVRSTGTEGKIDSVGMTPSHSAPHAASPASLDCPERPCEGDSLAGLPAA